MKEAIKSLLALILLTGFFELLLPEDGLAKYSRMVIGLIVLFSLINLALHLGKDFSPELAMMEPGLYPDTSALVAEGLKLRRAGEDQVEQMVTSVLQEKIERAARKITGSEGIRIELQSSPAGRKIKALVLLSSDPGVSSELLQGIVGELLGISPEQVEVEKEFEGENQ